MDEKNIQEELNNHDNEGILEELTHDSNKMFEGNDDEKNQNVIASNLSF